MQRVNSIRPFLSLHRRTIDIMGASAEISLLSDRNDWAEEKINIAVAEMGRVKSILSSTGDIGLIYLINENAGKQPVKVDSEIFNLIKRSQKISALTQGVYDVTYDSIEKKSIIGDGTPIKQLVTEGPTQAIKLINYENLILDASNTTVFLKEKGMRVGFGGIENGYAAERAKYVLQLNGVSSGVINFCGNLSAWGLQINDNPWTVGAADPRQKFSPSSFLNISNMTMSTAGIFENKIEINGKKYMHYVHPKNGLPVRALKSVSILSPSAELSAALTIPVTVLGVKAGLRLINRLNQIACVVINYQNKVYCSKNIQS